MVGDQRPADSHPAWHMGERGDVDAHRRDPCRFEHSLDVPHGHVADRSNWHEQNSVNLGGAELIDPERCDPIA